MLVNLEKFYNPHQNVYWFFLLQNLVAIDALDIMGYHFSEKKIGAFLKQ